MALVDATEHNTEAVQGQTLAIDELKTGVVAAVEEGAERVATEQIETREATIPTEVAQVAPEVTPVAPEVTPKVTPVAPEVTPVAPEVTPKVAQVTPEVTQVAPVTPEVAPEVAQIAPAVEEGVERVAMEQAETQEGVVGLREDIQTGVNIVNPVNLTPTETSPGSPTTNPGEDKGDGDDGEKEEKWDVEKEHLTVAKKSGLFLLKLLHMETQDQRQRREERRENARKKDRGKSNPLRYLLGADKTKKGGLFGMLKSIGKMLGGSFMKVIGPLWKTLKVLFKVLKFTALGAALIAGALFFSMSESDQQATIDSVMGFFKKVGEVLSSLGKAFGGAFMKNMDDMTDEEGNPIEGLVSKFGKFKEAWAGVLKKLSGISLKVGGKTYKGLEGFATMMGDLFGKIAGWFLDLGTGIAMLITDPRLIMTKMSVKISNFFGGMMDTVGRFIDEFTSMEFLLQFMPDWLRETDMAKGWIKDASESRAKDALKDMNDLAKREKVLKDREASVQKTYDEQKAKVDAIDEKLNNDKIKLTKEERKTLEVERKKEDDKRINAYDMILEAKAERDRNKDRFEYAKESFEKSSEITIKNRAKEIAAKKSGIDVVKMDNQLAELDEERKKLINEKLDQSGYNIGEFDLAQAEKFKEMLGGKDKISGKLDEKTIQKLMVEFSGDTGLKEKNLNVRQVNSFLAELTKTQNKLAKNEAATAKIETDAKSKVDKFLPAALEQAKAENLKKVGGSVPQSLEAAEKPTKAKTADAKPTKAKTADAKPLAVKPSKVVTDTVEAVKKTVKPVTETMGGYGKYAEAAQVAETISGEISDFNAQLMKFAQDEKFTPSEQKVTEKLIQQSTDNKDKLREILFASPLMGMFQATKGSTGRKKKAALSKDVVGRNFEQSIRQLQAGGLVTETGMAMLHGTVPKPELVLDNQAASLFMEAALVLKGIGLGSGMELMNLQRQASAAQTQGGSPIIISNAPTTQVNQNQAMVLPPSPIQPGNSEATRLIN